MKINTKRYDLAELAKRIQGARRNQAGDSPAFASFEIDNIQSVLETCVDFPDSIPESDRSEIIWEAITRAAREAIITAEDLEKSVKDAESAYLRRPNRDFIVATSITIDYFERLKRSSVDGVTIMFSRDLPSRFRRDTIQGRIDEAIHIGNPERLTVIRARVRARTEAAAFQAAIDAIDFLRGMWNFDINAHITRRHTWAGTPQPVNQILGGPIYTLHTLSGSLASEDIWAELKHQQFDHICDLSPVWERVRKTENKIRKRLMGISYAPDLRALFVRYTRALDQVDYDLTFNKLWSVFEHLAGSMGKYEDLIQRTLFLYAKAEREYARLILEHLRNVRNGLVHLDRSRHSVEAFVYQLKWFVHLLFRFHLTHGREFTSISTLGKFLDLPKDTHLLTQRVADFRRALRLQNLRPAV